VRLVLLPYAHAQQCAASWPTGLGNASCSRACCMHCMACNVLLHLSSQFGPLAKTALHGLTTACTKALHRLVLHCSIRLHESPKLCQQFTWLPAVPLPVLRHHYTALLDKADLRVDLPKQTHLCACTLGRPRRSALRLDNTVRCTQQQLMTDTHTLHTAGHNRHPRHTITTAAPPHTPHVCTHAANTPCCWRLRHASTYQNRDKKLGPTRLHR
jgi:hypothetical protein